MAVARISDLWRPVLFALGLLLIVLALAELVPAVADLAVGNPDWQAFALSSGITFFSGGLLSVATYRPAYRLELRQGFLLTVSAWFVVSLFGALPFELAALELDFSDSVFEAVSGLTTTGSTVLAGLDYMPPGILLWRGLLQWLGGIGIIAMAVLMLPFLRVGGMQLFRMESSDQTEKVVPRSSSFLAAIAALYLGLTLACALAYQLAGMTGFEAVVHAMTTVSTGGYSTSDASLGHFDSALVHWIAILFMVAGSLPFALYIRMLRRGHIPFWHDSQVRFFLALLATVALVMALWLRQNEGLSLGAALTGLHA